MGLRRRWGCMENVVEVDDGDVGEMGMWMKEVVV